MILSVIQFDVTRAVVFRDARTGPHLRRWHGSITTVSTSLTYLVSVHF